MLIVIFLLIIPLLEHYGDGALLQLMAKGPQDTYLTDDNYVYPSYPNFLWNYPTRTFNDLYDIRGYIYPWYPSYSYYNKYIYKYPFY